MALFPGWGDGGRAAEVATVAVVLLGLTITAGLVLLAQKAYADNEDRLVRQRVKEVTAVLTAAIPSIQAPLATTAEVVEEESGPDLFIPVDGEPGRRAANRSWLARCSRSTSPSQWRPSGRRRCSSGTSRRSRPSSIGPSRQRG